jgi:hypothetical protein
MPATTTIEVVGVKQTINSLRKIDPQLQKDFKADATAIAQPAINAGKAVYRDVPISNFANDWNNKTATGVRRIKGFNVEKARAGVKMRFDTRRNAVGVILIEQKDQAAAIFEQAGRRNPGSRLDNSLRIAGFPVSAGRTRLIGPAVYKARRGIEAEMTKMIAKTMRTVQSEL